MILNTYIKVKCDWCGLVLMVDMGFSYKESGLRGRLVSRCGWFDLNEGHYCSQCCKEKQQTYWNKKNIISCDKKEAK